LKIIPNQSIITKRDNDIMSEYADLAEELNDENDDEYLRYIFNDLEVDEE